MPKKKETKKRAAAKKKATRKKTPDEFIEVPRIKPEPKPTRTAGVHGFIGGGQHSSVASGQYHAVQGGKGSSPIPVLVPVLTEEPKLEAIPEYAEGPGVYAGPDDNGPYTDQEEVQPKAEPWELTLEADLAFIAGRRSVIVTQFRTHSGLGRMAVNRLRHLAEQGLVERVWEDSRGNYELTTQGHNKLSELQDKI